MKVNIKELKFGTKIRVDVHNVPITGTVVGQYFAGGRSKPVTSVLIGLKEKVSVILDYDYGSSKYGLFNAFNSTSYQQFCDHGHNVSYNVINNLYEYRMGVWINDNRLVDIVEQAKLVPNIKGKFTYIKASDVHVNDTIAWIFEGGMYYTNILSVDEGEDGDEPVTIFDCMVFCKEGMQSHMHGLSLPKDQDVLLINRTNNE